MTGQDRERGISPGQVLELIAEFEPFGSTSVQLVAWELGVPVSSVRHAWDHVRTERLIAPAGLDRINREELWRLTDAGRRAGAVIDVHALNDVGDGGVSHHDGLVLPFPQPGKRKR